MGISWYNNYILGISWDRRKSGVSYCHQPHIFFSVLELLKSNSTGVIAAASIPCPSSSQTTFEILWGETRWRTGRASRCARQKIRGHKGSTAKVGDLHPNFWGVLSFSPWSGRSWPEISIPPFWSHERHRWIDWVIITFHMKHCHKLKVYIIHPNLSVLAGKMLPYFNNIASYIMISYCWLVCIPSPSPLYHR